MTKTNENVFVFVLKDQDDNYIGVNSIGYYPETKKVIYSYSKTLVNGFYSYSDFSDAQIQLDKLNSANTRFKLPKTFHIKEVDMKEIALVESKIGIIKTCPFVHEEIDFDDNQKWIWVIKNQDGNFAHANSVKMWDKKTALYITYKDFSQECRGYVNQDSAKKAMSKLYSKIKKIGLSESFTMEYVNMDELIKDDISTDNMIIVEKLVA